MPELLLLVAIGGYLNFSAVVSFQGLAFSRKKTLLKSTEEGIRTLM